MRNWPRSSLYEPTPGPIEVEGGLLFHFDEADEACACAQRMRANGLLGMVWRMPGDLGLFVEAQ